MVGQSRTVYTVEDDDEDVVFVGYRSDNVGSVLSTLPEPSTTRRPSIAASSTAQSTTSTRPGLKAQSLSEPGNSRGSTFSPDLQPRVSKADASSSQKPKTFARPQSPQQKQPSRSLYASSKRYVQQPFQPLPQPAVHRPLVIPTSPALPLANQSIFKPRTKGKAKAGVKAGDQASPKVPSKRRGSDVSNAQAEDVESEIALPVTNKPKRVTNRPTWRVMGDEIEEENEPAAQPMEVGEPVPNSVKVVESAVVKTREDRPIVTGLELAMQQTKDPPPLPALMPISMTEPAQQSTSRPRTPEPTTNITISSPATSPLQAPRIGMRPPELPRSPKKVKSVSLEAKRDKGKQAVRPNRPLISKSVFDMDVDEQAAIPPLFEPPEYAENVDLEEEDEPQMMTMPMAKDESDLKADTAPNSIVKPQDKDVLRITVPNDPPEEMVAPTVTQLQTEPSTVSIVTAVERDSEFPIKTVDTEPIMTTTAIQQNEVKTQTVKQTSPKQFSVPMLREVSGRRMETRGLAHVDEKEDAPQIERGLLQAWTHKIGIDQSVGVDTLTLDQALEGLVDATLDDNDGTTIQSKLFLERSTAGSVQRATRRAIQLDAQDLEPDLIPVPEFLSVARFRDPLLEEINNMGLALEGTELIRVVMEAYIARACLAEKAPAISINPGGTKRDRYMADAASAAPPAEFVYSNEIFYGPDIGKKQSSKGCGCIGPCRENSNCFCLKRQEKYFASFVYENTTAMTGFNYDERGKVRDTGYPTWECSDACECPPSCRNRVMQRGRDPQVELEIFKTRQKGWGVKSRSSIERGTFIGIYTGELVPERNTDKRGRIYSKVGRTYLFDLDHWHIAKPPVDLAELDPVGGADAHKAATQMETEEIDSFYTVDAFHWGNFTRFINHSCDPNLIMGSVYYDDYDIRKPKLCITARRDIPAGQELCISYMGELDVDEDLTEGIAQTEASPQGKGRDRRLHNPHTGSVHTEKTATGAVSKKYYRCYCKAATCKGIMFNVSDD